MYLEEQEIDFTKLKYVLYARKSTVDETRQVKSIEEQIEECEELEQRLGLTVVRPYLQESQSAKHPNIRPIFTQMLKDLRNGNYDGILAWNPDRLARNMLEGGQIIDMIDENIIKDLKFVTHHFTKDANGKMLLGMAFVLSKQYSDKLSVDVTRGLRGKFREGRSHTPKHGYIFDDNGIYHPDGKNFDHIKSAWIMRSEEESYETIVKFLYEKDYKKLTKTGRTIKITEQMLTDIFKDPFYYGILYSRKTGERVDLREAYNFMPATDEMTYNKIQELTYRKIKPTKPHKTALYPLRAMIRCAYCNRNMYIGPSTGNTGRLLYARCDNSDCTRKKKSIRMKILFDYIYHLLERGLNFTEKDYYQYYGDLTQIAVKKRQKVTIDIHSKEGALKRVNSELTERSLGILKFEKDSEPWKINEQKINELSNQKMQMDNQISKLKQSLTPSENERLSIEQFLNLSKNASRIVQAANAIVKDAICRQIFLNFTVDEEKVLSYQAKEPFATLLKHRELASSADERT